MYVPVLPQVSLTGKYKVCGQPGYESVCWPLPGAIQLFDPDAKKFRQTTFKYSGGFLKHPNHKLGNEKKKISSS